MNGQVVQVSQKSTLTSILKPLHHFTDYFQCSLNIYQGKFHCRESGCGPGLKVRKTTSEYATVQVLTLKPMFLYSQDDKSLPSECRSCQRMQNWTHGFHHMTNNKFPQSISA